MQKSQQKPLFSLFEFLYGTSTYHIFIESICQTLSTKISHSINFNDFLFELQSATSRFDSESSADGLGPIGHRQASSYRAGQLTPLFYFIIIQSTLLLLFKIVIFLHKFLVSAYVHCSFSLFNYASSSF